jgi:outer membrane autotransporter protein
VQDQISRPAGEPAGSVNTPVGLSSVDALSNAANAAIGTYAGDVPLFYADMDTLIQRLGELRLLTGESRHSVDANGKAIIPTTPQESPLTIGTWVTGFGSGMHINDQASRAYDQNTGGLQLGADKRFEALHGDLYIGGFLSYFNASRDFLDGGNGSTNALSLGAYTTWVNPKVGMPTSFSSTRSSGTILAPRPPTEAFPPEITVFLLWVVPLNWENA